MIFLCVPNFNLFLIGALSKERREQKMTERQEEDQAKKTGSDVKSWQDPINQPSSRYVLLKLLTGQNELKKS
jgi:hypothetical protein